MESDNLSSPEELAADKLKAIANGTKEFSDFADVYRLLEAFTLEELTEAYLKKYPGSNISKLNKALLHQEDILPASVPGITLKDLAYRFKKAIQEPKRIFENVAWEGRKPKKTKSEKPPSDKSRGRGLRS